MDITIISDVANHCAVVFDDPQNAVGWVKLLAHVITPESFLGLVKATSPEHWADAQTMADFCIGQGA